MIGRRLPHGWTAEFIASPAFLQTHQWARARYEAFRANRLAHKRLQCDLCGHGPHDGFEMNVDHIKGRHSHPHLALEQSNLQVLCGDHPAQGKGCNAGKGRKYQDDWRQENHPYNPQRFLSSLSRLLRS